MAGIRSSFITGLVVLLPLFVAFMMLRFVVSVLRSQLEDVFGLAVELTMGSVLRESGWYETVETAVLFSVGLPIVLASILAVGAATKLYAVKRFMAFSERVIGRIPVLGTTYSASHKLVNALVTARQKGIGRVVLVEYPRRGIWSIGFVTATTKGEVQARTRDVVVGVYMPTTPNPTQGLLVFVPEEDVVALTMPFDDGMKLIVSGGVMQPTAMGPHRERREAVRTSPCRTCR